MRNETFEQIKNRIDTEIDVNDFVLNEIAFHGANNVFNSALSNDADIEVQEMAKSKIHELEFATKEE
jgi:hypothetical protein